MVHRENDKSKGAVMIHRAINSKVVIMVIIISECNNDTKTNIDLILESNKKTWNEIKKITIFGFLIIMLLALYSCTQQMGMSRVQVPVIPKTYCSSACAGHNELK